MRFSTTSSLKQWAGRTAAALALGILSILPASTPTEASHSSATYNQGLQGGWAVDDSGNAVFAHSVVTQVDTMHQSGAGWVRINFRLGGCYKDWTSRGCNGQTALQTYTYVVSEAKKRNLKVLGLLSNESWKGSQTQWTSNSKGSGDNTYIKNFADKAAGVLAKQFNGSTGPLVDAWEVWNEPNAWTARDAAGNPTGGTYIYPSNFAWLLKRSFSAIRTYQPAAEVLSGGIFGHDIGGVTVTVIENGRPVRVTKRGDLVGDARPVEPLGSGASRRPDAGTTGTTAARGDATAAATCTSTVPSGAEYLCATYDAGVAKAGWKAGAFPFTQIGQHVYIDQGGETTSTKLAHYLREMRAAYELYEGTATNKQTHLTEIGWETPNWDNGSKEMTGTGYVSPATQAKNLETTYATAKTLASAANSSKVIVGRTYWFSVQDVPEGGVYFGLVDGDGNDKCQAVDGVPKCLLVTYQQAAAY